MAISALWRRLDAAEMECVWKIVYFYERLWGALKHRYISRDLVPDLFGDAFRFWYEECFKDQLVPLEDPTARHIADLRMLMMEIATDEQVAGWEQYRRTWQLESRVDPTTRP